MIKYSCDCETATHGSKYSRCGLEAKYINRWGWLHCEEHKGFSDDEITTCPHLKDLLELRPDEGKQYLTEQFVPMINRVNCNLQPNIV